VQLRIRRALTRASGQMYGMHMPHRRRTQRRRPAAERWRETCVDGVLHAAFAAAIAAEGAAQRCARHLSRPRRHARRPRPRRQQRRRSARP